MSLFNKSIKKELLPWNFSWFDKIVSKELRLQAKNCVVNLFKLNTILGFRRFKCGCPMLITIIKK